MTTKRLNARKFSGPFEEIVRDVQCWSVGLEIVNVETYHHSSNSKVVTVWFMEPVNPPAAPIAADPGAISHEGSEQRSIDGSPAPVQ